MNEELKECSIVPFNRTCFSCTRYNEALAFQISSTKG